MEIKAIKGVEGGKVEKKVVVALCAGAQEHHVQGPPWAQQDYQNEKRWGAFLAVFTNLLTIHMDLSAIQRCLKDHCTHGGLYFSQI